MLSCRSEGDLACARVDQKIKRLKKRVKQLETIRISGTCTDTIIVNRSDVTLLGQAGATVQAAGTNFGLLVNDGSNHVNVADLRFTGGQGAAAVSKGSHVIFNNVVVEQTNLGVVSADNGTIELSDSRVENNSAVGLGNNIGILCNANAGYVLPPGGSPGNVTRNTAGNIIGCVP